MRTFRPRLADVDRDILLLAIPALGSLAIDPLLTLADTAFVARLGTVELAALGVDAAILTFAFFAFNFLAFVTTPLVAKAIGQGRREEAGHLIGTAVALALVLGTLITVMLQVGAPWLVSLMGAEGEVAIEAVSYLRIRAFATIAVLLILAANGAFRGNKDTRTPLMVAAGMNGLNLVLDPLLIFAFGLGLQGAALATVVAQWLGAAWFLYLLRARSLAIRPRRLAESLPALLTLGKNGVLLTIRTLFLLATFTFAASTATRLGPEQIAAHQLVAQLFLLSVMIADALEIAGQALVAEETGRGDVGSVRALTWRLLGWGLGVGFFLLVFIGLGRHALGLLASEETVAQLAVSAAGVAALLEPVAALVFVADGIFVGLLSLGTMAASTGFGAVAAIALMIWSPLGDTLNGIWWALGVFLLGRGLVFVAGYRRSIEMAVRS